MKIKSIVSAIGMAVAFGASFATVTQAGMLNLDNHDSKLSIKAKVNTFKPKFSNNKLLQTNYFKSNSHEGTKLYIIRLVDSSVTSYKGNIPGLDKANKSVAKTGLNAARFNPKSAEALKYIDYLEQKQGSFINQVSNKYGIAINKTASLKYAINGIMSELTYDQAKRIGSMAEVAFIEQDQWTTFDTDTGPTVMGANNVWDGTAGSAEYRGEGTIIAIIDTGINTDHDSFAATGDDGYTVVNPNGDGVYTGDCIADATLCNSKLIGVWHHDFLTGFYAGARPSDGQDYGGHGSHTSSTAAGNALVDVALRQHNPYVENPETQDGLEASFVYSNMSGVAPHANVLSYQSCLPGNPGDALSGCSGGVAVLAVEDIIARGDVDAINYSIGGTVNFSPWTSSLELAFLNANAAGVFVATSAGNSGPNANTSTKAAPWYTAVAASNHGLVAPSVVSNSLESMSGGATAAPANIVGGGSRSESFTGDFVYAGDFANANDPDNDSAQCLQPFPAETFLATQIVVCDRGAIARTAKGENAAAGGAGGFVLANLQGGAATIAQDFYAVPGVHISADDGDVLKLWIADGGAGHAGTITGGLFDRGANTLDQIADFSSRGSNEFVQMIVPSIAAPGVSIFAAWADDTPFNDATGPSAADYATISGTSMASPHIAGASLLVKQAHPEWNPDQIRSALMMTANNVMTTSSGVANVFDMGSGRAQVDSAINAGLVLTESLVNYTAADPAIGGDPRTLNVPSMANFTCDQTCSWTRSFNVVTDGTYTLTSDDTDLTIDTASFDAVAGDIVNVVFTMDSSALAHGSEVFGNISITSPSQPDLHLPTYVKVNHSTISDDIVINAGRDDGSFSIQGLHSLPTDNLTFVIDGLFDSNAAGFNSVENFELVQDPTINTFEGLLDFDAGGLHHLPVTVPANSAAFSATISEATATDNDLYIMFDSTGDGTFDSIAGSQANGATNESVTINSPAEGSYLVVVQNWGASAAAIDTGVLTVDVTPLTEPQAGLTIDAPTTTDGVAPLAATLFWNKTMAVGEAWFANITMLAGEEDLGTFRVDLNRIGNDVTVTTDATLSARGDAIEYTLRINPNQYDRVNNYSISVDLPKGMILDGDSVSASSGVITVKDPNAVGLNLTSDFSIPQDTNLGDPLSPIELVHDFRFEIPAGTLSFTAAISGSTSPDNDLWVYYDTNGDESLWTLVAVAATGATNEITTVGSPVEGNYRAIVQNYDDSTTGALDTGVLTITSIPATGEGFLLDVASVLPSPSYSVVSSVDDALCAVSGLRGAFASPTHVSLSALGVGTIGVSGDEELWNFGLPTTEFYGKSSGTISVSSNGFVTYTPEVDANQWNNLAIPNTRVPNNMIAALWKDQVVVDDGTRGFRIATVGNFVVTDIEGAESFGIDTDRFTYNVTSLFNGPASDDHGVFGPYEVVVSYADTQVGSISDATAGIENDTGTEGVDGSSLIVAGGQLCYDAINIHPAVEVTFSVIPTAEFAFGTAKPTVSVELDMLGTADTSFEGQSVDMVNVAPTANAGEDTIYLRDEAPSQIRLSANRSVDLDEDVLSYKWTQTGIQSINLFSAGASDAFFNLDDAAAGTYSFRVTVSDGEFTSNDLVNITIEGKKDDSGVGSFGSLMLLLLSISFYTRRRYSK